MHMSFSTICSTPSLKSYKVWLTLKMLTIMMILLVTIYSATDKSAEIFSKTGGKINGNAITNRFNIADIFINSWYCRMNIRWLVILNLIFFTNVKSKYHALHFVLLFGKISIFFLTSSPSLVSRKNFFYLYLSHHLSCKTLIKNQYLSFLYLIWFNLSVWLGISKFKVGIIFLFFF